MTVNHPSWERWMNELDDEVHRSVALYSKPVLRIYDAVVVYFSNSWVWRCHRDTITGMYQDNVGRRHLDVGPGTGWHLAQVHWPDDAEVTLFDLNTNTLAAARARLGRVRSRMVVGNVLEPLPDEGRFDSIGLNYVMHCVPGDWNSKGVAFDHLAARLAPGGVLFGGTILSRDVPHSPAGRALMKLYNARGYFHNTEDDLGGLERALRRSFENVSIDVVGAVAMIRASTPSRQG